MVVKSITYMPLRSFMGFTGGILSTESVLGLVDMCNGKRGGFKRFCKGFKHDNTLDAYSLKIKGKSKK